MVSLTALTACAGTPEGPSTPAGSAPSTAVTTSSSPTGGAPPTTSTTPTAANTVPEAYHGHWNTRLTDCPGDSGEGRLIVEDRTMTFYESVGQVISVTPQSDRITVTLRLNGEGETWEETRTWTLSPDRNTLTDVTDKATRFRCT